MRLARDYLRSKRGLVRLLCAAITVTTAFTLLRAGADPVTGFTASAASTGSTGSEPVHGRVLAASRPVTANPHVIVHWNRGPVAGTGMTRHRGPAGRTAAGGPRVPEIAFSVLLQTLGVAIFGSGTSTVLYARSPDLATLRALGWRRRQVRRRLMREFTTVAAAAGLLAVLAAYAVEAGLEGRPVSWWPLLSMPAAIVMMLPVAWWHVLQATTELAAAKTARPSWARWPHAAGQARRNLPRVPARTSLGVLVIAAACGALGLELDGRRAFSGMAAGSSLSLPPDRIDVVAVLMLLAMAAATVADLGWLTAAERVGELRTRRAMGWPVRGVVRLAAWEAVRLGLAGGLVADALDVAGSLAVARHGPGWPRPLTLAVVAGAGVVLSLVAAGLSAAGNTQKLLFTSVLPPFRTRTNTR